MFCAQPAAGTFLAADVRPSLKYRLATHGTVIIARCSGVPLPWPEPVHLDEAVVVARWAVNTQRNHPRCLILAPVSRALRVCLAAQKEGLTLAGATFMIAGEPATPAKVRGITRTGARAFPTYGLAEAGRIGVGCRHPDGPNDVHLLKDAFAVIQYPRQVPGSGISVSAFKVTSLLLTTPKLMLNVEIDDYGVLEPRSCGCPLADLGYTEHLRDIRSFRKLTGEGVTLVAVEMIHILEEVLPARFGGSPLDYQLVEEEDKDGFTRLTLLVSPKVKIADESAVIKTVMESLGQSSVMADSARAIWGQAQIMRVRRAEPIWTSRGKLMPLLLGQCSQRP